MQDGITEQFYTLMDKLQSTKRFLDTLNRFGVLTEDETRVIYHQIHFTCVDLLKKS